MKTREGKMPLSFKSYSDICMQLAIFKPVGKRSPFSDGVFGWNFMTRCRNMIARSISVTSLLLEHFGWIDDCMTITIKYKGETNGRRLE